MVCSVVVWIRGFVLVGYIRIRKHALREGALDLGVFMVAGWFMMVLLLKRRFYVTCRWGEKTKLNFYSSSSTTRFHACDGNTYLLTMFSGVEAELLHFEGQLLRGREVCHVFYFSSGFYFHVLLFSLTAKGFIFLKMTQGLY